MSRDRGVAVEALDEARWDRIEDAVFERIDRGALEGEEGDRVLSVPPSAAKQTPKRVPFRYAALVAFGGAIAAATGALVLRSALPKGHETAAAAATSVVTGESGSAVRFGDADLSVAPRSKVMVTGDAAHGVMVSLEEGSAEFDVAPREGRPPFEIVAGDARVRVVGTHFSVARDGASARVHVDHGSVEVKTPMAHVVLRAGETFPAPVVAPSGTKAELEPVPSASDLRDLPSHAGEVDRHLPRVNRSGGHLARRDEPEVGEPKSSSTSAVAPAVTSPSAAESPRERFERAARLEAREPVEAQRLYRDIANGTGPWASNALFAAGRLAADKGNKSLAKGLLEEYLRRFPNGANAADARELLGRIP